MGHKYTFSGVEMEKCLFCNEEPGYKPGPDVEYICGSCVQLFLAAAPEQVRAAYRKAVEGGYSSKARALEIFFKEGVEYEQEAGTIRSDMVRERPQRAVRPARYEVRA